jgi:hypothetical protein
MDDIQAILDNQVFKSVKVCGKEYQIGKIKVIQYLGLAKFLAKTSEKDAEAFKNFKQTDSNVSDILVLLEILDPADISELMKILLNTQDDLAGMAGEELINVIEALCEYNDFGEMLGKVQRVIGKFQKK